jgi:hypothetical protein
MHTVVQEQGLDGLDQQKLTEINDQLDVLEKVAPVVPDDINVAVERRYEVYKFEDEAEKQRSGQEEER